MVLKKIISIICLALCGAFAFESCKEPVILGKNILPGDDDINALFTDTFTIIAKTVREDSLISNRLAANQIGCMMDPIFGKTSAGIYTQVRLPTANVDLGDNLVLDSLVLWMDLTAYYGDTAVAQTFQVYRMTELMPSDSDVDSILYYSHQTFTIDQTLIGEKTMKPNLKDSIITAYGDTYPPCIRIRLEDVFANDLLAQSGTPNFADNDAFLNYLNGIYITTDTTTPGSALYLVNLLAFSSLTMYYSNDEDDSLKFDFVFNPDCVRVGHYTHNYSGSIVEPYLNSTDPAGDNLVFAQGLAGLKAWLQFPYIGSLGNVAINKAELIFTETESFSDDSIYKLPTQMTMTKREDDGANGFIDDVLEGSDHFGGKKETVNVDGEDLIQYRFNLARHFQLVIDGNTNYGENNGIYLLTNLSTRHAGRIVFGGGTHPDYKIELLITYTKIL